MSIGGVNHLALVCRDMAELTRFGGVSLTLTRLSERAANPNPIGLQAMTARHSAKAA
jgi:hypothetical protein